MRQKQTRHAQGKGASLASGQRGPLLYRLEDTPAIGKRLLYSLQFVVIFMGSVVLVPMLVAEPWDGARSRLLLLQCAILPVELLPLCKRKGSDLWRSAADPAGDDLCDHHPACGDHDRVWV